MDLDTAKKFAEISKKINNLTTLRDAFKNKITQKCICYDDFSTIAGPYFEIGHIDSDDEDAFEEFLTNLQNRYIKQLNKIKWSNEA